MNYRLPSLMDSEYEHTELCLAKYMVPQAIEQGEHCWYSPLLNRGYDLGAPMTPQPE
jgi:hypothetical protein